MKQRSVKVEKHSMWFADMQTTASTLADKAQDGWLVTDIEPVKGEFTFRRGEPEDCCYYFQPSESKENLAVYTDLEFVKVLETNGLALWKRAEEDPAALDNLHRNFYKTGVEEEEEWLCKQAKQGRVLLRTSRPDYTFLMTEPENLVYRIVYNEDISDYKAFLEEYTSCGWEYVWGNNGFHYFVSPEEAACSQAPFDRAGNAEALFLRRRKVYGAFLAFSSGLAVLSWAITAMNLTKYINLTKLANPDPQTLERIALIGGDITLNFAAVAISTVFFAVFLTLWLRASRKMKRIKKSSEHR